jgi:hypothetical protein
MVLMGTEIYLAITARGWKCCWFVGIKPATIQKRMNEKQWNC